MPIHLDELVVDIDLDLSKNFPLQFPFGEGSSLCNRMNKISHEECVKHHLQLSLPQINHPGFVLVISHMINRINVFMYASYDVGGNAGDEWLAQKKSRLIGNNLQTFINDQNETVDGDNNIIQSIIKTISAS
jgi:hypothetical protein